MFNPNVIVPRDTSESENGETERALRLLEKMLENPVELGVGRAGRVFSLPEQSICIKQIIDGSKEFSLNNVKEEIALMAEARGAGVRVPHPMMAVQAKEGDFIVMETIDGHSIKDIWAKGIPLPPNYDHDRFWDTLERLITRLNGAGIHHRDLHEGNVMMEWTTGDPVIIDFGLSCQAFDEDDPYREVDFPRVGELHLFNRDRDQVTQLRVKMLKYLQRNRTRV
ncbi:MAG: phosphotransferase [Candidatus Vogelbacteria bacterium]|nr:phosphotransferase [Candidatus Vogelbacteria bacterium]